MVTVENLQSDTESRMRKSVDALKRELGSIRTGRANPAVIEGLMVNYYGAPTPLNQLATISVPEAHLLLVQPWDGEALKSVEKGILASDLGLVPNNDGNVIRINIPTLTEDRRKELVRLVGRKVEEGHVAIRNVRRDALEQLRRMEKGGGLSQDELKRAQAQIQRLTDSYIDRMDSHREEKNAEVMEV